MAAQAQKLSRRYAWHNLGYEITDMSLNLARELVVFGLLATLVGGGGFMCMKMSGSSSPDKSLDSMTTDSRNTIVIDRKRHPIYLIESVPKEDEAEGVSPHHQIQVIRRAEPH